GEPQIFHCNHYNRVLQLIIEDCHYIAREAILIRSAAEVSHRQLQGVFAEHPEWSVGECLQYAETLYRYCGFGDLALHEAFAATDAPLRIRERHSHYGAALRLNYGKRRWPGEFFDLGFAEGALKAAFGQEHDGHIDNNPDHPPLSMGGEYTDFVLRPVETSVLAVLSSAAPPSLPNQEAVP
ncbi:hypothetical protein AB4090_15055, partial [Acidithiobacillus sp. IBUN Pt1247-S3]